MSEEKQTPSPDAKPRNSQQRQRRNYAFQYIAILFAAAFALLLYTFVMERHQHQLLQAENQEQIDSLQQSVSAVQSLQNLYDENAALKQQVDDLQHQLDDALDSVDGLTDTVSHQEYLLEQTCQAMDYFWQIDEAYVRGKYTLCRQLIQVMEDNSDGKTPLKEYLSQESYTDNERFSPADRYQEIYDKLY
jgi:cell division protein FtsB